MPEPATITLMGTGFAAVVARFLRDRYNTMKPRFDRFMAALLAIGFAPVITFCAALIKLTSKGPVFYSQDRVGQHGRVFRIVKLRTMRMDAEKGTGPIWANPDNDARVTPVGRFLRKSHLDEVPQLINVLRGEMSLVGPRPERPHFVEQLCRQVPNYELRLKVKPGITGLAQVRAGYDQTLRDVRRKVKLDAMYIRRMCWWVDFMILARTMTKFLGRA